MENKIIQGKTIKQWEEQFPLMNKIVSTEEVFRINPQYEGFEEAVKNISLKEEDVKDAERRFKRFAPYIAKVFPETKKTKGIIESPFVI
ncbi:hypothetical protein ACYUJ6_05820 [Clostridium sp. JNZ X4-2]